MPLQAVSSLIAAFERPLLHAVATVDGGSKLLAGGVTLRVFAAAAPCPQPWELFQAKMDKAGLSQAAQGAFKMNYEQLVRGVTGLVCTRLTGVARRTCLPPHQRRTSLRCSSVCGSRWPAEGSSGTRLAIERKTRAPSTQRRGLRCAGAGCRHRGSAGAA